MQGTESQEQLLCKEAGTVRWIVSVILVILTFVSPEAALSPERAWFARAALHNFFHVNVFHLAVNLLAFWTLYRNIRDPWKLFPVSLLIGTFAYVAASGDAIGFSDVIYASIGLLTPPFRDKWWRKPSTIVFLAVTLCCVALPYVSASTHITAFLTGVVLVRIKGFFRRMNHDIRRAAGHD